MPHGVPCPSEAVPVQEAFWWHAVHAHGAAHTWLREVAARTGAASGGGSA
ncbi:hypothetical protein [Actinomadura sediminis]|uniref:LysR family transcriptional regulator n=1 Tax=Actinomadura sediminis TaxID=1038904 RepID=A0ABW3ENJ0_9ACTN